MSEKRSLTIRDSTRGTISTRFLKSSRSTFPPFVGAFSEDDSSLPPTPRTPPPPAAAEKFPGSCESRPERRFSGIGGEICGRGRLGNVKKTAFFERESRE